MDEWRLLLSGHFDFLDFGCSTGGSIDFARKYLGGVKGLGLDNSPTKVALARENGYDAVCANILDLPNEKLVDFVILSHFLEHLEHGEVNAFLTKAIAVASKFVLVQQPFFDSLPQLLELGLKPCYSHWSAHRNNFTSFDFWRILESLHSQQICSDFSIGAFRHVSEFSHWSLVPLAAPIDSKGYDPAFGPKPSGTLPFPHFEELWTVVTIDGNHLEHQKLARQDCVLMSTVNVGLNAQVLDRSEPDKKEIRSDKNVFEWLKLFVRRQVR